MHCCVQNWFAVIIVPEKKSNEELVISVIIPLVLVLVCLVSAVLFILWRRRRRGTKQDEVELPLVTDQKFLISLVNLFQKGREAIDEHRTDGTYVPTKDAKKGKRILAEKKILLIQGITGSGKTKTALQIASEWMREDEYSKNCIYLKSLDDLESFKLHDNTCIILDGCFTRWVFDSSSTFISRFCLRLYDQIKSSDIYIIITIHMSIYSTHRSLLQTYDLFSIEHHLTLKDLDHEEKKSIFTSHLLHSENSTRQTLVENQFKLLSNCAINVGFPSVCWMYTNIPECEKEGFAFFRECELILQKIICNMKKPLKCCLFYAMLRYEFGEFDTNDIDDECLNVLKREYSCDVMTDEQLLECFGKDNPYFISRGNDVFSFSQTVIYETCLKICFSTKRHLFLRLCNLAQVKEYIRDETYRYKLQNRTCILTIRMEESSMFAAKFAAMMKEHKELEYHSLLQNARFRRIVHAERIENENHPVVQKEIPDVHMEWETRPLMHSEALSKQLEQQRELQQQQQYQPQQRQQEQERSPMQRENIDLDCQPATLNEIK